jgi:hypothetical protein
MDPLARAFESLPGGAAGQLRAALAAGERITHVVPAIGCVLALTDRRLLVLREGSAFRPKTGVREWALVSRPTVRPGLVRQGTGSIVIQSDRDVTSVFVRGAHWNDALSLIGALRGRVRILGESQGPQPRDEDRKTDG